MQLTQLLHGHVLLGPGEGTRQGDVEGVLQDEPSLLGAGLAHHHFVEGRLHVEHGRGQLPLAVLLAVTQAKDRAGGVVQHGDPHRLGEPASRVDRQHYDRSAALGGSQRQRRRRSGLPDPARATAHDDPGLAVIHQGIDVQPRCWSHQLVPPARRIRANSQSTSWSMPFGCAGSSTRFRSN